MNIIWAGMMLVSIAWGLVHGNMGEITLSVIDSSKDAVVIAISMLGIMAFWSGILEIGSKAGIVETLTRRMSPVLGFLFPKLPEHHPARTAIATNMVANILGLGWAATPAGLLAMEKLGELEAERQAAKTRPTSWKAQGMKDKEDKQKVHMTSGLEASDEMCTFLIINISSLQLIPVNMIAYRSQYGAANPAAIVGPGIVATLCSTLTAVVFCKAVSYLSLKMVRKISLTSGPQ